MGIAILVVSVLIGTFQEGYSQSRKNSLPESKVAIPSAKETRPIPGIWLGTEISKTYSGYQFTEGPAWPPKGKLFFTDLRSNRILKADANGEVSTFLENTRGVNGIMFSARGQLIACQGLEGRIVAIDTATKNIQVVAEGYKGTPFIMPNDLAIDRQDGIYFTDPSFREGTGPQDKEAVYFISKNGAVRRILDDLTRPNGITLSPDERILYVLPSSLQGLMAYPLENPGIIGRGNRFGRIAYPGDGMTVDSKGNLYVTQPRLSAVQILSPKGDTLGFIYFPEVPSNCKFGGPDMKTLFVTARTSVYAVKMQVPGFITAAGGN